ncbi:protease [Pedobacter sp. GR22-6]|uniref:protease n=1 Tax=Pedobacter sp. GR22-6 TaxID=3127957 RepID=UPI00307D6728
MKNTLTALTMGALLLAACGTLKENTTPQNVKSGELVAKMYIQPEVKTGSPVEMRFTVYNRSNKSLQFCKWHTPFEPPLSKYLDITHEQGSEVLYSGAMAKRIMPPPADSYISLKAGDSLSVNVDISKIYKLDKIGKYTVRYVAEGMSGLSVKDSISFTQTR